LRLACVNKLLPRGADDNLVGIMRRIFYVGVFLFLLFEVANVYFVMPMPGSQRMRSIDVAYFLYTWRWELRLLFGALIVAGVWSAWSASGRRKWLVPGGLVVVAAVAYATNFVMAADRMFLPPTVLTMEPAAGNKVEAARLVVGVELNGEARAYPIEYIGYHHQVRDEVGGSPVLVSYCTVCRTGRVFVPTVNGRAENFRLVGMDHFNAMFEDATTGSWWRQANGEAIVGPRTGTFLREIPSVQVTLKEWLALHPGSLIMQADSNFNDEYAKDYAFENGTSRKTLTGTDTVSWHDKAWVVGLTLNRESRAFDWNRLRRERVVNDEVGGQPIVLALAGDTTSFFAFERPDSATRFALRGDSLVGGGRAYALSGRGKADALKPVFASQEFWHSWREFHPGTTTY
jgi:hypothetical protein